MTAKPYICKNCGELREDQLYIPKEQREKGRDLHRRCKKCANGKAREYVREKRRILLENNTSEELELIKEKNRLKIREDRAKYPEKYRGKEWRYRKAHPLYVRTKKVREYGLTATEYEELLKSHNNLCAICKQPETFMSPKGDKIRNLSIDHCHKKDKVRGLLCTRCNMAIGYLKEDDTIFDAAAEYIRKFRNAT